MSAPKHSRFTKKGVAYIDCAECERGGNGADPDKCSCGWQVKRGGKYGCYCGLLKAGLAFEGLAFEEKKREAQA